jgi:acyl-coenzyme A synthetase/AMP-(fatty) acid ligase
VTGTALHEALGMSECSTFLSGAPARPAPEGTLGFAQAGRRLAVLDEDGAELPDDAIGTLAVHRGDPGLMLGYWTTGGTPELPLTGDWFETGDRVSRRPDGAFVYHGRRDDLITAGGFRVAPQEIEAVFHGAPGVEDCAALAISPKPDTTIIALAFRATPPRRRSRNWRRRGWRATSNRGPSSISTPCPDPRTENSTGARWPRSCERPCHDPARHHLRPDLPVVLYRLDQPRPRDGGAARTTPSRSSGTRFS